MYKQLSLDERIRIEVLLEEKRKISYIAQKIGRNKSTISREIKRNTNRLGIYNPESAHHRAYTKKRGKKKQMKKIRSYKTIEYLIRDLLLSGKSPEKVSMRIQREYHLSLSGSTIRRYIDSKFAGELKDILLKNKLLKKYKQRNKAKTQGKIPHRVSIDVRPIFISSPLTTGHYECDFIVSCKGDKTVFLTLVDKYSRFKIAIVLPHKEAWLVEKTVRRLIEQYGIKSITFDNDLSFAKHYLLGIKTYFSNPYCSWEKGQIERANRDRRKFFPKGTLLKNISQHHLNNSTHYLNHDPMKCFAGRTPREVHFNTDIKYLPLLL